MGARGPQPTPTAQLEAHGSWRANINKNEPLPEKRLPPMPPGLTGVAKQAWMTYEPILYNLGVLTEIDGLAFEQLCIVYADWVKYKKYLKAKGELIKVYDKHRRIVDYKVHPYAKLKVKAQEQLNRLLANFGMTPADRSRIVVDNKKKKGGAKKIT